MKFGVNKKILLYTAGCVWIFAGINILRIGIVTWLNDTHYWLFKIGEATIVFLLFFNLVFKRLFYKHSEYGIIHGVDHNGILILETRKNRWELRIEN